MSALNAGRQPARSAEAARKKQTIVLTEARIIRSSPAKTRAYRRWRRLSDRHIPALTETFRLSTAPRIGMRTS